MDCIFCKIVNKEVPSEIIYEDAESVIFKDIHPKAPVHFLVVSKQHIVSVASDGSESVIGYLIGIVKKIAQEQSFAGYKLVLNVGKEAGQTIEHLHMHLLAGGPSGLAV